MSQQVIFRRIYIYIYAKTYAHAITTSEERDHEFEGEERRVCGRL